MAQNADGKKIRGRFSRFFNIKQWIGSENLTTPLPYLKNVINQAFELPAETKEKEDFSKLVEKLGLTEEQIRKKKKAFLRLCTIFIVLACLVMTYAVFHVAAGHYRAFFPTLVLFFVCLAFAFRYHFWYMQIKMQKLGCSFQEWCNYVLPGRKK